MFESAKNLMLSKAAQTYANSLIARYGVVRDLKIDPKARTIEAVCLLHGESAPITVRVDKYQIVERNGKKMAELVRCTCSRPWAQALIDDFAKGRPVELPSWAASAL